MELYIVLSFCNMCLRRQRILDMLQSIIMVYMYIRRRKLGVVKRYTVEPNRSFFNSHL